MVGRRSIFGMLMDAAVEDKKVKKGGMKYPRVVAVKEVRSENVLTFKWLLIEAGENEYGACRNRYQSHLQIVRCRE